LGRRAGGDTIPISDMFFDPENMRASDLACHLAAMSVGAYAVFGMYYLGPAVTLGSIDVARSVGLGMSDMVEDALDPGQGRAITEYIPG